MNCCAIYTKHINIYQGNPLSFGHDKLPFWQALETLKSKIFAFPLAYLLWFDLIVELLPYKKIDA